MAKIREKEKVEQKPWYEQSDNAPVIDCEKDQDEVELSQINENSSCYDTGVGAWD